MSDSMLNLTLAPNMPVKRAEAERIAKQRGLTLPEGPGKLVLFTCDLTGKQRFALASVWNAGRVTHRGCCGKTESHIAGNNLAKQLSPVTAAILQDRAGLARASIIAKGYTPSKLFSADLPTGTPLAIRVTQFGVERVFHLPPEGVAWLKWVRMIDTDPLNAPNPPTPHNDGKDLAKIVRDVEKALTSFAWTLHQTQPTLDPTNLDAYLKKAHPTLGILPALIPRYTWSKQATALDWATEPPTPLTPLQIAALAVMALEWSAAGASQTTGLRHCITRDLQIAKPLAVTPREWFRDTPELDFTKLTPQEVAAFPTVEMPDGASVMLQEHQHLRLIAKPPTSVTLPANWHDPLPEWDWESTIKTEVVWPSYWNDLPEIV